MKRFFIFSLLLTMVGVTAFARGKTITIGKCTWLTEQNSIAEIGAAAVKEKKPVLAVFSATWCRPCQDVKKNVFAKDEFKKVADKAILLYIEQTDPKGMEYVKKYKVHAYPTFAIIDKDGTIVDTGHPQRTVEGFLKWVEEVNKGNTQLALEQRLKKKPDDREAMLKMAGKFSFYQAAQKIQYLEKVIGEKPDYNDPLTKKACQQIITAYQAALYRKKDNEKQEYLKKCDKKVLAIFAAYLPDGFDGQLKGPAGYASLMKWHITLQRPAKAIDVYNNYMKRKTFETILPDGASIHAAALDAFLKLEKTPEAVDIYEKLNAYYVKNIEKLQEKFLSSIVGICKTMTDYYLEKKQSGKAAEMFSALIEKVERWEKAGKEPGNTSQYLDYMLIQYAETHDMFREKALARIDKSLKKAKGISFLSIILKKAMILNKAGKKAEAREVLLGFAENQAFIASIDEKIRNAYFNSLAWTLHDLGLVDEKALKVAEKSVTLKRDGINLDTLACIHADLGNYKKAVELEEEALKLTQSKKSEFQERLDMWKKKMND